MKKWFWMLAIVLPMVFGMVSCSSSDDELTDLTEEQAESLIGTWNVTKVEEFQLPGERKFLVTDKEIIVFQKLPADANFEEVDSYTYTLKGTELSFIGKWSKEVEATATIVYLSGNNLKIKLTDLVYGYGSYTMHLVKQK